MNKIVSFLSTLLRHYIQSFKDIVKHSSIFTTLVLSVFLYSFFYPIAYQAEHAESLPIIVVDEEQSILTNTIIGAVANSPNVEIRAVTGNFAEAENMLRSQQADAYLRTGRRHAENSSARASGGRGRCGDRG